MKNYLQSANEIQNELIKENDTTKNEHVSVNNKCPFSVSGKRLAFLCNTKFGKYMKIYGFLILLSGIAIVFNSCVGGYIATEPSVTYYERPQRPSETHIWIDGDWNWSVSSHTYVQKAGYWEQPRPDHSYVQGHWESNQHGKSWSKGYWEKNNNHGNQHKENQHKENHHDNGHN